MTSPRGWEDLHHNLEKTSPMLGHQICSTKNRHRSQTKQKSWIFVQKTNQNKIITICEGRLLTTFPRILQCIRIFVLWRLPSNAVNRKPSQEDRYTSAERLTAIPATWHHTLETILNWTRNMKKVHILLIISNHSQH